MHRKCSKVFYSIVSIFTVNDEIDKTPSDHTPTEVEIKDIPPPRPPKEVGTTNDIPAPPTEEVKNDLPSPPPSTEVEVKNNVPPPRPPKPDETPLPNTTDVVVEDSVEHEKTESTDPVEVRAYVTVTVLEIKLYGSIRFDESRNLFGQCEVGILS